MDTDTPNILITDDDTDILEMMKTFFTLKGWFVDTATTPRELINRINEKMTGGADNYDAILCDINFFGQTETPRQTGISTIAEVRVVDKTVPVIFVSAYVNELIREQIKEVGGTVMSKPVDLNALYRKTAQLINEARQKQVVEFESETPKTVPVFAALQTAVERARQAREQTAESH